MDFTKADHTIVLSDIHLSDAEPVHEHNPLWKRFKRRKYFVDRQFKSFLEKLQGSIPGSIELVLNGDIFDFDSVLVQPSPERQRATGMKISFLETLRGLSSEEAKSTFKMDVILNDHHVWVETLKQFLHAGNRVVFVIGNHDVELHWPAVQEAVRRRMELPEDLRDRIRFCEWFYISNADTMIEHGNQYDPYCICQNPIHPLIKMGNRVLVRLPFGNLAGKLIINGIGLMNPHVESSYIKSSIREYLVFFYTYMMRVQPTAPWSWFWSAVATLLISVSEGLLPALRDPLMVEERVSDIARKANATPAMVRLLRELHVHPAVFNPFRILRELWLDRLLLLGFILFVGFEIYAVLHLFGTVSFWWWVVPVLALFPPFLFYAKGVESEVGAINKALIKALPMVVQITGARRIVQGHTHMEAHRQLPEGIEYMNPGTWSPAYEDVECTRPYGRKCFVWIRPSESGQGRIAVLQEWKEGYFLTRPVDQGEPQVVEMRE